MMSRREIGFGQFFFLARSYLDGNQLRTSPAIFKAEKDIDRLFNSGVSSCNISDKSRALFCFAFCKGLLDGFHAELINPASGNLGKRKKEKVCLKARVLNQDLMDNGC